MTLPNHQKCQIVVIGMGYVGLPLAVEFSNKKICLREGIDLERKIIGFDINELKIKEIKDGFDRTNEIEQNLLKKLITNGSLNVTHNTKGLENSDFFIITVPTPIDTYKNPNLIPLKEASKTVGNLLKIRNSRIKPIIILESTVFPGATEDICAKTIEEVSSLKFNKDFFCGYSPERINPGDKEHRLSSIIKIVSGSNKKVAQVIEKLYGSIIKAGIYLAPSIKVAEAAKIIENTQRDLNIALINELAIIFKKMNIDTLDILEAAKTKWNFLPFKPGLVGGHCIGVDPYYLTHKAKSLGFMPKVILAGRETNDNMASWIEDQFLLEFEKRNLSPKECKILILGITFKENCPDYRNTKVINLINSISKKVFNLTIVDPWADKKEILLNYGLKIYSEIPNSERYDAIICAVAHNQFKKLDYLNWENMIKKEGFFFDIKGIIPRELNPVRI